MVTKTSNLLKSLKPQTEKKTPIATDMFIPNHSGDLSRGKVITTPTADLNPVNKKYVDNAIAGVSGGHIIKDEAGVDLTARRNLNFTGAGVTATDNAGSNSTDVTIPAWQPIGSYEPANANIQTHVTGTGNPHTAAGVGADAAGTAAASSGTTSNTYTIDSDSTTGKIVLDVALGAADKTITITNTALTDNRTATFQNASGTIAYTSDIPAETDPLSWSKANDQTLLTGDKSGSFDITTTGDIQAYDMLVTHRMAFHGSGYLEDYHGSSGNAYDVLHNDLANSQPEWTNAITQDHIHLTVATGTKPLDVTSTTACTNLNADMTDGFHATNLMQAALGKGCLINGKIVPSVSSYNLTLAIKGLDGNDPSASNVVYCRIGDTIRTITSALSVTKNAGTNWCNAGSAEHATKEIDYFAYLGYNATDGVVIGFSRIPYARLYSEFSTTTTSEKYCAISTITNAAAGDEYENIGRFPAALTATATFRWSIPTLSNTNLYQRPTFNTRWLAYNPTYAANAPMTYTIGVQSYAKYQITNKTINVALFFTGTTGGSAGIEINFTAPFNRLETVLWDSIGSGKLNDGTNQWGQAQFDTTASIIHLYKTTDAAYGIGAGRGFAGQLAYEIA